MINFIMQENQLLRDRKKNTKKRLSTGENNTSVANITNQVRASGPDSRAVKMVLLDNQNIEKVGTGKGSLFKRPANIGINRTNFKVDQAAAIKTVKHRRKNGNFMNLLCACKFLMQYFRTAEVSIGLMSLFLLLV